jgi:hypothetical protein
MAGGSISSSRSPTATVQEPAFASALKPLTIGLSYAAVRAVVTEVQPQSGLGRGSLSGLSYGPLLLVDVRSATNAPGHPTALRSRIPENPSVEATTSFHQLDRFVLTRNSISAAS